MTAMDPRISMKLYLTRLAYDRNKNGKIEQDEVIRDLTELKALDKDQDGILKGSDLKHVYWNRFGRWLPATKPYRMDIRVIRIQSIDLKEGIHWKITPRF